MGIGASVFLLTLGAVLAFAVDATVSGLDISVIGFILMAAGVVGLFTSFYVLNRNRGVIADRGVVTDRTVTDAPRDRVIRETY